MATGGSGGIVGRVVLVWKWAEFTAKITVLQNR